MVHPGRSGDDGPLAQPIQQQELQLRPPRHRRHCSATDNTNASATSPGSGNYIYTVNDILTDATILSAEFLTLPKTDGVTVNLNASANQEVSAEYGNASEFKNPIRIPITVSQPDTPCGMENWREQA